MVATTPFAGVTSVHFGICAPPTGTETIVGVRAAAAATGEETARTDGDLSVTGPASPDGTSGESAVK